MTVERVHERIADLKENAAKKRANAAWGLGMTALSSSMLIGNLASKGDKLSTVLSATGLVMSAANGVIQALGANELGQEAAALHGAVTQYELQTNAEAGQPFAYPEA